MAAIRSSDNSDGGTARSRLIVGLVVLILALVLGMAWQAHRSVQAHNDTAVGVLVDYAHLAADEYTRRAMAATGYYGYYTLINGLRTAAAQNRDDITAAASPADPSKLSPSLYVFSIALPNLQIDASQAAELSPDVRDFIVQNVAKLADGGLPDSGYVVEHASINQQQHSFVVSWIDDASLLLGFEVNRDWLMHALQQAFADNVLLPESLAGGAVTNDLLYLQMRDSVGEVLFETGARVADSALVSRTLSDEYGGVFRGHTLTAAIDPAFAESLIIGGLPRSRLPVAVAVILLAIGMLIAAIWQLQRENAVMQMRSNFVAEVSHELRTPLTQIRMFTESLMFDRIRSSDEKRRALSIINRESQRLGNMVENILRFSDGDRFSTELKLEAQDLQTIVESVGDEFQVLAAATDSVVETSAEPGIIAKVDADAIRQILLNLLDNAIKYGPHAQTVTVTLRKDANSARLAVIDQGPSVPISQRRKIWNAYYRLDRERDSAIAGTGIGLAIVADLVAKHHGVARVEDSESGGARFVIELPL